MTILGNIILTGQSNQNYRFDIYSIGTTFNNVGAVYAISKRIFDDNTGWLHSIFYIGRTDNLRERLSNHHKLNLCLKSGANCLLIHQETVERNRELKEVDLIGSQKPPFNEVFL